MSTPTVPLDDLHLALAGAVSRGFRDYARDRRDLDVDRPLPQVIAYIVDALRPALFELVDEMNTNHRVQLTQLRAAVVDLERESPLPDARHAYGQVLASIDYATGRRPYVPVALRHGPAERAHGE